MPEPQKRFHTPMTAQELYGQMFAEKRPMVFPYGYAELSQDVVMEYFAGYFHENRPVMRRVLVGAGTTVKVVMVSRLGDLGCTEDLDASHGYGLRTFPDSGVLVNCRRTKEREDV